MSFSSNYRPTSCTATPLSNEQLQRFAPSIFARQPIAGVSDRYAFLPTACILDGMRREGWVPTFAVQQPVRKECRQGFQKHLIRFSRIQDLENRGETRFEVAILNSHDRSSGYKVQAGLLRLTCLNGLLVSDETVGAIRIRHTDFQPAKVIEATFAIAEQIPVVLSEVETFKARALSGRERQALAIGAHAYRWEEAAKAPITPAQLLAPRRPADQGNDLWRTFNRVQEQITKGGQLGRTANGKRTRVRGVKGIDEDARLNRALWRMAVALRDGKLPPEAPAPA
jgi:hypothetical protein